MFSKIIGGVGKALGISADPNAGAGQARASQAAIQQAVDEIKNLDLPDIEKEQLLLELQSDAGFLEAEQLGPSATETIQLDPRTQQAQMQALQDLQDRAQMGMTPEDMALMDNLQDQEARRSQTEQAAILQGMAERGTMDSGMQLAAQLSAQQGAADRGQDRAMDMAGQNFAARQQAIANLGNLGTSMGAQDFSQQSQVASAADQMAQFNANNRADANRTNLGIRQSDVATRNQEQSYNKGLIDRDFQRRQQKAGNVANALTGQASNLQNQANAAAQAEQNRASGMMDIAKVGAIAASDSNKKKGVTLASQESIEEFLNNLTAYKYEYKDEMKDNPLAGKGEFISPMAQDLEKSKLGAKMVIDTSDGKIVDYGKGFGTMLASQAFLNKRLNEIEEELKDKKKDK